MRTAAQILSPIQTYKIIERLSIVPSISKRPARFLQLELASFPVGRYYFILKFKLFLKVRTFCNFLLTYQKLAFFKLIIKDSSNARCGYELAYKDGKEQKQIGLGTAVRIDYNERYDYCVGNYCRYGR